MPGSKPELSLRFAVLFAIITEYKVPWIYAHAVSKSVEKQSVFNHDFPDLQ